YETFAASESAEVPFPVLKFRRDAVPPQRQVLWQIRLEYLLSTGKPSQVAVHGAFGGGFRNPPERFELVGNDLAQAEFSGHVDLRRQQAGRLDLSIEQRFQTRAEAADIHGLDAIERHVLLDTIRHVEVASSP